VDRASGAFQATLEPGDYAAWLFDGCYACTAFTIDEEGCTQVSLQLQPVVYLDAPNVYLYPTETTRTQVRVPHPQAITAVAPEYPMGGWQATATPSGLLHTTEGPRDFLFYELALPSGVLSEESGCCVPGNLAQASIEDAMSDYGFLESEIEDFAEFWDPVFPDAKWITVRPKVEELPPLLPRSGVGTAGRARAPAGVVGALGIAGCQGNRAGLCVLKHERSTGAAAIRAVE
jgi:hypothetical protein